MDIDVRFSNGNPQTARAYFTLGATEVTAKYNISNGVATLDDIDVPLRQAGKTLDLAEFNALKNGIDNAGEAMNRLTFINDVR